VAHQQTISSIYNRVRHGFLQKAPWPLLTGAIIRGSCVMWYPQ